jgi:hypothetical protein
MMVLMAVVTTLMTTPLLHWIYPPAMEAAAVPISRIAGAAHSPAAQAEVASPTS